MEKRAACDITYFALQESCIFQNSRSNGSNSTVSDAPNLIQAVSFEARQQVIERGISDSLFRHPQVVGRIASERLGRSSFERTLCKKQLSHLSHCPVYLCTCAFSLCCRHTKQVLIFNEAFDNTRTRQCALAHTYVHTTTRTQEATHTHICQVPTRATHNSVSDVCSYHISQCT